MKIGKDWEFPGTHSNGSEMSYHRFLHVQFIKDIDNTKIGPGKWK